MQWICNSSRRQQFYIAVCKEHELLVIDCSSLFEVSLYFPNIYLVFGKKECPLLGYFYDLRTEKLKVSLQQCCHIDAYWKDLIKRKFGLFST